MAATNNASIHERLKPETIVKISYEHSKDDKPEYVVGYWSIRGLAAPIRMMLSAAQVNHWAMSYDALYTKEGGYAVDSWLHDKAWVKNEGHCDLMNLPFLVICGTGDGDNKDDRVLAQSNAVMMCLGRKLNMLGSNDWEQSLCESFLCELMDLRDNMTDFVYTGTKGVEDDTSDAKTVVQNANKIFDKFEAHLSRKYKMSGSDNGKTDGPVCFLVGDQLSAPDFHLWELIDQYIGYCEYYKIEPTCITETKRPCLYEFHTNFRKLPQNKQYMDCELSMSNLPYNNPSGRFGTDPVTKGLTDPGTKDCAWHKLGVINEKRPKV